MPESHPETADSLNDKTALLFVSVGINALLVLLYVADLRYRAGQEDARQSTRDAHAATCPDACDRELPDTQRKAIEDAVLAHLTSRIAKYARGSVLLCESRDDQMASTVKAE